MYLDNQFSELLNHHPDRIRDDLKQELTILLLQYDCDRLLKIISQNKFYAFVNRIMHNMVKHYNNQFHKSFVKSNDEVFDWLAYVEYIPDESEIEKHQIEDKCVEVFNEKRKSDAYGLHEYIIFNKYIELQSMKEVAIYFNVPYRHIRTVVEKVKIEIKNKLND